MDFKVWFLFCDKKKQKRKFDSVCKVYYISIIVLIAVFTAGSWLIYLSTSSAAKYELNIIMQSTEVTSTTETIVVFVWVITM